MKKLSFICTVAVMAAIVSACSIAPNGGNKGTTAYEPYEALSIDEMQIPMPEETQEAPVGNTEN